MNGLILGVLVVSTFFAVGRDKKQYSRFKAFGKTEDRLRFYRRWTVEPFLLYGCTSLLILGWLGQLDLLLDMPAFLAGISHSILSAEAVKESDFLSGMIKGMLIALVPVLLLGGTIGSILGEYRERKKGIGTGEHQGVDSRDLEALIPRNYKERVWGVFLSLNAGFSEEIFFRLLAPLLIYDLTGSTMLAILCSTIWFGLAHYYQGVTGIILTALVGLVLFCVYVVTESIWVAMVVHAILDINGLVLGPWLRERFARAKN